MNPGRGFFITGTDTDAGKTYIGSRIVSHMHRLGLPVSPRKPAESGCKEVDGSLTPADAMRYFEAVHGSEPLQAICPFRFRAPLAPVAAARLEKVELTLDMLEHACVSERRGTHLVVEGAGGFYSPIAEDGLNADLAQRLDLPIVLVAQDKLGTLNHILMSLELIQRRNLKAVAVILNRTDPLQQDIGNAALLNSFTDTPAFNIAYGTESGALAPLVQHLLAR